MRLRFIYLGEKSVTVSGMLIRKTYFQTIGTVLISLTMPIGLTCKIRCLGKHMLTDARPTDCFVGKSDLLRGVSLLR
jgi:hypothetical protein